VERSWFEAGKVSTRASLSGFERAGMQRPRTEQSFPLVPARSDLRRAALCRRKFLRFFPGGFRDQTYIDWERGYKWKAHDQWEHTLSADMFRAKLRQGKFLEIGAEAIRIESRTNLLFSFEKMALRDALKTPAGAEVFATSLFALLHSPGTPELKFEAWCQAVASLPHKQSRVFTWPVVTVFGFIAQPDLHIFLKPTVTRVAAREYGVHFHYRSRPSWETYSSLLNVARQVCHDLRDLRPRDMIDIQSFLWVRGSDEYAE
jgi:hypothetical protein